MKRIAGALLAMALGGTVGSAFGQAEGDAAPVFGIRMPEGYRDWRLISVAREEGMQQDIRAVLGNDLAIKAYRDGTLP
jgi:hypothetical protein